MLFRIGVCNEKIWDGMKENQIPDGFWVGIIAPNINEAVELFMSEFIGDNRMLHANYLYQVLDNAVIYSLSSHQK